MEINCPSCGHSNSNVRIHCNTCGLNIYHLVLMQKRIVLLEEEASQLLDAQDWLAAYGVFSILLEYKPSSTKYIIGLGTAAAELNELSLAEEILLQLSKRLKKNKELQKLSALIKHKNGELNNV